MNIPSIEINPDSHDLQVIVHFIYFVSTLYSEMC